MPERPETCFTWFNSVDDAYAAMLDAIAAARISVRLETYIFQSSPIADAFRDALVTAARRGASVQVLIDAWGSPELRDDYFRPLVEAGGQFRWFNPFSISRFGIRNHRKLLVCDERVAFVGGFNIAPEYQGDGLTRGWRDFGVRMEGDIAHELALTSDHLFARSKLKLPRLSELLEKLHRKKAASTPCGEILLSGPGLGKNMFGAALLHDLARATEVRIHSAYFLPSWRIRRALAKAARRGGRVQLILAGRSDVALALLAARGLYQGLLRAGVEIYEYQPQILHAKVVRIDDAVYVGSSNLDARSLRINYELMIRATDPAVATAARAGFERDLAQSLRIDPVQWPASRSLFTKFKERIAAFLLARVDPYLARKQMRNFD
jgi:cardiolipin synthase